MPRLMYEVDMQRVFNEWMRRYIADPVKFAAEFKSVELFRADAAAGLKPSYGETCAAYMFDLLDQLNCTKDS